MRVFKKSSRSVCPENSLAAGRSRPTMPFVQGRKCPFALVTSEICTARQESGHQHTKVRSQMTSKFLVFWRLGGQFFSLVAAEGCVLQERVSKPDCHQWRHFFAAGSQVAASASWRAASV